MPTTVAQHAVMWLERLRGVVAESTRASYRTVVAGYLVGSALGLMLLTDVGAQDVRDFLLAERRAGWTPGFVRLMQPVVVGVLQDAMDRDLIPANPAARLWRHVPPALQLVRDPTAATPAEGVSTATLAHLRETHPDLARVVAVYHDTGCRRNEALGLRVDDLDFAAHTITICRQWFGAGRAGPPKGRHPRTIDMARSLEPVLVEAIPVSDALAHQLGRTGPRWLFRSPYTGLPWNPGHVTRVVRAASLEATGKAMSPKGFRHAVATRLLYRGQNPRYVQLLLGHRSLSTTLAYVADRGLRHRRALDALGDL